MRCGSLFDPVVLGEAEFLEVLETFALPGEGEVGKSALGPRIERIFSISSGYNLDVKSLSSNFKSKGISNSSISKLVFIQVAFLFLRLCAQI